MSDKKKHIANRRPDVGLNDGVHFDDQLKAKKEKKKPRRKLKLRKKKAIQQKKSSPCLIFKSTHFHLPSTRL